MQITKEKLKTCRRMILEVKQLDRELEQLRRSECAVKSPSTSVPSGGNTFGPSAVEKAAIKILELEMLLSKKRAALYAEIVTIESAIESMKNPTETVLLRYRYIEGLKWEEVCVLMGYSWQQIHRIHARALSNITQPS